MKEKHQTYRSIELIRYKFNTFNRQHFNWIKALSVPNPINESFSDVKPREKSWWF